MRTRGFGLVEIVVSVAVLLVIFLSAYSVIISSLAYQADGANRVRAELLLEEGHEAMRLVRDTDWTLLSSLSVGQDYWLRFENGTWSSIASEEPLVFGMYDRTVRTDDLYRDGSGNVTESGTVPDQNIKKVTVSVRWENPRGEQSVTRSTYVAKIH